MTLREEIERVVADFFDEGECAHGTLANAMEDLHCTDPSWKAIRVTKKIVNDPAQCSACVTDLIFQQVRLAVERDASLVCKHCRTFGPPDFNDGDYIGHTMPDGAILDCRGVEIRAQLGDARGEG